MLAFVATWATTKTFYTSMASYHAYLEYTLLVILLAGMAERRTGAQTMTGDAP